MRYAVAICTLAALLVSACAGATSRAARSLEVRSGGRGVLGCLPADEGEVVEVDAAGVSAVTVGGRSLPKPWTVVLDPENPPFRLAPGECLEYGQLPDGYSSLISPAELKNEWPYTFAIRSPEWGRHRTRNYSGTFCIRKTGADLEVVSVPKGPAAVTVETCRQLLDAASGQDGPAS